MKKLIVLALIMPGLAFGQVRSDFETGDLNNWTESTPGRWKTENVSALSGLISLHHIFDNPVNGFDCIGLKINNLHPESGEVKWSFLIRHGYDPSSSNNWNVMLMSDSDPVAVSAGLPVNGFAIGVNLSGYDDTLKLWKLKEGVAEVLIKCPVNWQTGIGTANPARLEVTRGRDGRWEVIVYGHNAIRICSATAYEKELFRPGWFIINYRYTSTRDRLLWFDDLGIDGVFYADTIPPLVDKIVVTGRNTVSLELNEEADEAFFTAGNFLLDGQIQAESVNKITGSACEVRFGQQFSNKLVNSLQIRSLCDLNNNCITDTVLSFIPAWAVAGDIVISEVMADPLPAVGLPPAEYLELFNRTAYDLSIAGFSLLIGEDDAVLPEQIIKAGQYLILCSVSDTTLFSGYGKTGGMKSFPVLADEGRMLALSDSTGVLIHGIEYSKNWYGDKLKQGGGWSLELIDSSFPFYGFGNWRVSWSRTGGSPGKKNSAAGDNPDVEFAGIENVFPVDDRTLNVNFYEPVINLNELAGKIFIDDQYVVSVIPTEPLQRQFRVKLAASLEKDAVYLFIISPALKDFAGNDPVRTEFGFGIPEDPSKGDLVFNELLFNPVPNVSDYIELFSNSEKIMNAGSLILASIAENGDTSDMVEVSGVDRCILPGAFYTLTTDKSSVLEKYPSSSGDKIFETGRLPSMPDERGHLLLLNRELDLIDEVIYSKEMHHKLLAATEGVALEKVRPDISSVDPGAWHSASESVGWGTPGIQNSVFSPFNMSDDRITFSSGRISPDNDGYEDVLVIDLDLQGNDNIATISVFDETGRFIKRLTENFLAGEKASVVWDATADDGSLVRTGIYILFIECFNPEGKTGKWKKVCTVIN